MKIELDDQILNHPKFIRAVAKGGSAVVHLWLGLRAYCSQQLSDGFIPDDMMAEIRGPADSRSRIKATNCLAECNLLHRVDNGWVLHDYLDHSSSREQVLAWREANRKRKRQSRNMSQRDGKRDSGSDSSSDGKRDATVTTSGVPEPSYPLISDLDLGNKEEEISSPPNPPKPTREDPFMASFTGTQPGQLPEVLEIHRVWRETFGKTGATIGNPNSEYAKMLRDAVRDYGLADCLAVIRYAPKDGMVNGKDDEKGKKHDDLFYILGNKRTFDRLLVAAKSESAPKPKALSVTEQMRAYRERNA